LIAVNELTAAECDDRGMLHPRDMIRIGLAATMLVPASMPIPLHADSASDHDQGRRAVERGEALPLVDILARVRPGLRGEVVGVSFERERGRWVYELKVIETGGRLVQVYVDAASAEILKRERD
jgi:uncharacterized membrane protein YkoI